MMNLRGAFILVLLAITASGCASRGGRPTPDATAFQQGSVADAIAKLESGDFKAARRRLKAVLKREPSNVLAAKLLRQIDADPKTLLGTTSFAYIAKSGDSFRSLAERFLGDRMMFYALARYNGVSNPSTLMVGGTLRIPGALARPQERPEAPKPKGRAAPRSKPALAPPSVPAPAAPALAMAMRERGLAALSRGDPDRAVLMLTRAASLDPANTAIAADLARAVRVRNALNAGR